MKRILALCFTTCSVFFARAEEADFATNTIRTFRQIQSLIARNALLVGENGTLFVNPEAKVYFGIRDQTSPSLEVIDLFKEAYGNTLTVENMNIYVARLATQDWNSDEPPLCLYCFGIGRRRRPCTHEVDRKEYAAFSKLYYY